MRTRLLALVAAAACIAAVAVPTAAGAAPEKSKPKPKVKVLVLGDSAANGLALGLQRDKRLDVVNDATVNCTLAGGTLEGYHGDEIGSGCPDWRTEWPALVQQAQPKIVLVFTGGWEIVDRWFDEPSGVGLPSTILEPVFAQNVSDAFKEAGSLLSAGGAKVAFLTSPYIDPPQAYPIPPGVNGISEIWWEPYGPDAPPPGYQAPRPGQPFVGSKAKIDAVNQIKLDAARQGGFTVFDLQKFSAPDGAFTLTLKGKNIRDADRSHFNDLGYDMAADWLVPKLQKLANKK